jgi:hypothetical protein
VSYILPLFTLTRVNYILKICSQRSCLTYEQRDQELTVNQYCIWNCIWCRYSLAYHVEWRVCLANFRELSCNYNSTLFKAMLHSHCSFIHNFYRRSEKILCNSDQEDTILLFLSPSWYQTVTRMCIVSFVNYCLFSFVSLCYFYSFSYYIVNEFVIYKRKYTYLLNNDDEMDGCTRING